MFEADGWTLTEHVCRHCLGAVLRRGPVFCCSTCREETTGSPNAICGCGVRGTPERTAGTFRCVPNPHRSPANPAFHIIAFGDGAAP